MTKKGMKGWIIGLAAFAMLATTGVGLTGYFTKGFTQWKANENTSEKVEESSKDSSALIEGSSLPGDSEDSSVEDESDVFNPAKNKAAFRHVMRVGNSGNPMIDYSNYTSWNKTRFQVDDDLSCNLPVDAIPSTVTKDYIALVVVIDRDFNDYFNPNKPIQNCNDQGIEFLKIGDNECILWGDSQSMRNRSFWIGFMIDTQFDYDVYFREYNANEVNTVSSVPAPSETDVNNYQNWTHTHIVTTADTEVLPCSVIPASESNSHVAMVIYSHGYAYGDIFLDSSSSNYLTEWNVKLFSDDRQLFLIYGTKEALSDPDLYAGFDDDFEYEVYYKGYTPKTIVNGQTKDIFVDVDRNYSKESIIGLVKAQDLFGVDCDVTVTSGLDTFTPATIGVYTLTLQATDDYGQSATATLIVHICDYVAPVITQAKQMTFVADKNQSLSYADLSTYISVTDNGTSHGSSLTITYKYDGTVISNTWSKTFTAADYGSHNIAVTARDGSGNEKSATLVLSVTDGTAPVLTRTDGMPIGSKITIGVSKTFNMDIYQLTVLFKATDNVDGNCVVDGLTEDDRNFFTNNHRVGSYTLTICAKDANNNQVIQAIPIEIVADIPPVFIIADTLVYTDTANPLDVAQLNLVVSNGILAGKNISSLSVDASEYIGHETEPGTYHIDYEYTLANNTKAARRFNANGNTITGAFDLIVQEANKDPEPEEPKEDNPFVAFFKSIGDFFVHFGNWFRGVFTHFDFTCWLSNEEFDERYPAEKEEVKESSTSTSTETPADTSTVTD